MEITPDELIAFATRYMVNILHSTSNFLKEKNKQDMEKFSLVRQLKASHIFITGEGHVTSEDKVIVDRFSCGCIILRVPLKLCININVPECDDVATHEGG